MYSYKYTSNVTQPHFTKNQILRETKTEQNRKTLLILYQHKVLWKEKLQDLFF